MKKLNLDPESLRPWKIYRGSEGGAIYTAEAGNRFFAVVDESIMADLLSEEDVEGLELRNVWAFEDSQARLEYLEERYGKSGG